MKLQFRHLPLLALLILSIALFPANFIQAKESKNSVETNIKYKTNYFVPILVFHHLANPPARANNITLRLHYSPKNFEEILQNLQKNNYQTVFVSEIVAYLELGKKLPNNWVALSFDDGYEDFYTNAWPLLKKYNAKASLYVITSRNGGDYLTKEQIKEIDHSQLVEIGSHTVSHPQLSRLSPVEQLKELKESKADLERLLKKDIVSICYPYGSYNLQTEIIAKKVGYKYGLTYNRQSSIKTNDIYEINRIGVWPGMDVIKFLEKFK
jgi:peptidoglycan/xylan/chitin deacetylase (PgdA/CDA1 family)